MLFNLSDAGINHSFGMQGAGWCVDRARMIIHEMMALEPETIIPEKSIQAACEIALERLMKESRFQNAELLAKMKKPRWKTILKRVAIFVAVIISSGIVLLSVSATAREIFLKWVIKVFPEYSSFSAVRQGEIVSGEETREVKQRDDFHCYIAAFIPDDFSLDELLVGKMYAQRRYLNDDGKQIEIMVSSAHGTKHNLNTEDVEVVEMVINGHGGYHWIKSGTAFLVWEMDGFLISVTADVEMEIAMKVAESIFFDSSLIEKPI